MVERRWRIGCLAKEITERRPVPLWLKNEMRYADVREIGMSGLSFSQLRRILLGELQYRGRMHRGGFWWDGDKRRGGVRRDVCADFVLVSSCSRPSLAE